MVGRGRRKAGDQTLGGGCGGSRDRSWNPGAGAEAARCGHARAAHRAGDGGARGQPWREVRNVPQAAPRDLSGRARRASAIEGDGGGPGLWPGRSGQSSQRDRTLEGGPRTGSCRARRYHGGGASWPRPGRDPGVVRRRSPGRRVDTAGRRSRHDQPQDARRLRRYGPHGGVRTRRGTRGTREPGHTGCAPRPPEALSRSARDSCAAGRHRAGRRAGTHRVGGGGDLPTRRRTEGPPPHAQRQRAGRGLPSRCLLAGIPGRRRDRRLPMALLPAQLRRRPSPHHTPRRRRYPGHSHQRSPDRRGGSRSDRR